MRTRSQTMTRTRRGELRLRTAILSTVPGWKEIMATASPKISACVESPYLNELTEFKKLVADPNPIIEEAFSEWMDKSCDRCLG